MFVVTRAEVTLRSFCIFFEAHRYKLHSWCTKLVVFLRTYLLF